MASQDFKFIQKIFSVTRSGQKLTLKPICIVFILIFWWLVGIVQPAFLHHFAKAYNKDVKSLVFFMEDYACSLRDVNMKYSML